MTVYTDNNKIHDHTYIGNGCPNLWGDKGAGGAITPCADSRFNETIDHETQSIGAYYNYQAATSGSGGAIETDNSNASDTFCPLGWQLPYGGTGGDYYNKSKSWQFLINQYGIVANGEIEKYPISFIESGIYIWYNGKLYFYSIRVDAWTTTNLNGTLAYQLRNIIPTQHEDKTVGMSVRCVKIFDIFSSTARWKELM